jgi:hypothetical protein
VHGRRHSERLRPGQQRSRDSIPARARIVLFFIASRPTLGSNQPTMQWVTWGSFSGLKRSGSEADHLRTFSADIKNS